jgi:hypothetical protein
MLIKMINPKTEKMKTIRLFLILIMATGSLFTVSAQTDSKAGTKEVKAAVYYFHNTARCVTCKAVEDVSKEAIKEYYGTEVSFIALNISEPDGRKEAERLGVSGQTLLITGKNQKINITTEAFMNARSNPDKLKELIKEKIDPLIK